MDASVVRAWGAANGWPVGRRGRLSAELFAAYRDEVGEASEHALESAPVAFTPTTAPVAAPSISAHEHTLTFESGYFVVKLDGVELYRHGLGSAVGAWCAARGVTLKRTHEDAAYQALDVYRMAKPARAGR